MPNKIKTHLSIKVQAWYQRYIEPYLNYYWEVLKYAAMQTSEFYNFKREWKDKSRGIIFQLIVIAIIFIWRSKAEGMEEMNAFISILLALGIVVIAIFLWHLLRAPVQLYLIEKHKHRTTWLKEMDTIAKEQRGVDLLTFSNFPYREQYKTDKEHKITYRVGARTIGRNSIEDVGVSLVEIKNLDLRIGSLGISILPIKLRVMGSSQDTIRVDPSTEPRQFFDVIEWYPQKSQIRICYHNAEYKDGFDIRSRRIALKLVAQGRNVMETKCIYYLILKNKEWHWYSEEEYKLIIEAEQKENTNEL